MIGVFLPTKNAGIDLLLKLTTDQFTLTISSRFMEKDKRYGYQVFFEKRKVLSLYIRQ